MIPVETAIRAWVQPNKRRRRGKRGPRPFRPQPHGERVLVFDTETTTDHVQRLLFGFFRVYSRDRLVREAIIASDLLNIEEMRALSDYAVKRRLPIFSRERFVEEVFYPEVYELGTLCVGFNLPFDLARIALGAGGGRGKNRRAFRLKLSRRIRWPDLRVESASGKAAFIKFAPKRHLARWEKPFFPGRFLDLSTLTRAFVGGSRTLKSACKTFRTHTRKMGIDDLGTIDRRILTYGRQDVRVTWALYRKLRSEYAKHPFATFENERRKPKNGLYMGEIYSSASIAKQYLRLLGFRPLLEAQSEFNRRHLGRAAAAYYGGRSEVRVRRVVDMLVAVLDYTSMYPTIMILQDLQELIGGAIRAVRCPGAEIQTLLNRTRCDQLFDPAFWPTLNCLVEVDTDGAILPARMRQSEKDPYTIAVTPLVALQPRWYTLADVIAAVLLGEKVPKVRQAFRFVPKGAPEPGRTMFRGKVPLRSDSSVLKTLVEERKRAKTSAKDDPEAAFLETGLKVTVNSVYGVFAEINVTPHDRNIPLTGMAYSDIKFKCDDVHDERPGAFANPIIAALITGGARLMLAMLESEVRACGGTFAFCDTDSLAIVRKQKGLKIPGLSQRDIDDVVLKFDDLNPYDTSVQHLLKVEYEGAPDLRCYAVSAKRYVLYRIRPGNRIQIVKASESGLGAVIGRTRHENTAKLARRIWLTILFERLKRVNPSQRRRAKPLVDFEVPLRRKFPISQPSILQRFEKYNRGKSYDFRIKPSGFMEALTLDVQQTCDDIIPVAPFERDLARAKRLEWIDYNTGERVQPDWNDSHLAGTLPVMSMITFVKNYARHPESKAADRDGNPAGEDTIGILERLPIKSVRLARIGKEVDRLYEDSGASLTDDQPIEYESGSLTDDVTFLANFSQERTARDIGITPRRLRDIFKGKAKPRGTTADAISRVATLYRSNQQLTG